MLICIFHFVKVLQRRQDNTNFYRTWAEYKKGFGNDEKSFWLGNCCINAIIIHLTIAADNIEIIIVNAIFDKC